MHTCSDIAIMQWTSQKIYQHIYLFNQIIHPPTDSSGLRNAAFGQGTGPIFLDNFACIGSEAVLTNCTHDTHTADCTHFEDASVTCKGTRKKATHL